MSKDGLTCVKLVMRGWHGYPCGKPAKFYVTKANGFLIAVCGVHCRQAENRGYKMHPLTVKDASA